MTKKQLQLIENTKSELCALVDYSDIEVAHEKADDLLCELLKGLKCGEVVEIYLQVPKWYA